MENKINAFTTSCYRVMLNIKSIDHVLNTTVYSMTNTVHFFHLVRHRQLKFLGHILRMSKEEPARRYALHIQTIGKRRPGQPRTSYLTYVQRLFGENERAMHEQQIAALADDRGAWGKLVVACSAADGWWRWTQRIRTCAQVMYREMHWCHCQLKIIQTAVGTRWLCNDFLIWHSCNTIKSDNALILIKTWLNIILLCNISIIKSTNFSVLFQEIFLNYCHSS